MIKGHRFLKEEFDITPRIGWMIDAFGHSAANARLFTEFGFEALFVTRIDNRDSDERQKEENHSLTFLWRPQAKHFG